MKNSDKYQNLDDLFGAYFNQDWDEDYDSPEAVISGFARDGDKKGIEDAICELQTLLKENHTKEEWFHIINEDFGCCYALRSYNIDPSEWLKKVQKQLKDELVLAEKKSQKLKP